MRVISIFRREVDENAIFWDVTRRVVLIPYRLFGKTNRSHFHGSMDFPETAVSNYHCTLSSIQEGCRRHM